MQTEKQAQNPLVSVIVPVYNAAAYLDLVVGHILAQTYQNLEVILVDDGSTDGGGALCDDYAARDPRVKVFHQANSGASAARNLGIERCTGDYVVFVDSDDLIHREMVEILVDNITRTQADLAVCGFKRSQKYLTDLMQKNYSAACKAQTTIYEGDAVFDLLFNNKISLVVVPWAKLYPASLIKRFRYSSEFRIAQDNYLATELLDAVNKLVYTDLPLVLYKITDTSLSANILAMQQENEIVSQRRWQYCVEKRPNFALRAQQCYVSSLIRRYEYLRKRDPQQAALCLQKFKEEYAILPVKNKKIWLFAHLPLLYRVVRKFLRLFKR